MGLVGFGLWYLSERHTFAMFAQNLGDGCTAEGLFDHGHGIVQPLVQRAEPGSMRPQPERMDN